MIRMPDALESSIQKATDLGAIGIIVPTVDDALEARDAARFSRYPAVRPPQFGRRLVRPGLAGRQLPRHRQRQHARHRHDRDARRRRERRGDRRHARRRRRDSSATTICRASRAGRRTTPATRTPSSRCTTRRSKYGKYFGNAGAQYLNGYVVSADTRMVQNGPARDGWTPPRGGGPAPAAVARHQLGAGAATRRPNRIPNR